MTKQNNASMSQQEFANEEVIDLRFLFGLLQAHKWFIVCVTAIFFVLAGIYAAISPALYESTALIQVQKASSNASNVAALLGIGGAEFGGMSASAADVETSLIQSDYIMSPVIERLGLNISATQKHFPIIGRLFSSSKKDDIVVNSFTMPKTFETLPFKLVVTNNSGDYILYNDNGSKILIGHIGELASSAQTGISLEVKDIVKSPGAVFILKKDPTEKAVKKVLSHLTIKEQGERTGILQLTYTSPNPETSQTILNTILKTAVEKNIAEKAEEATKTLAFLQQQLPIIAQNLDSAEKRLNNYRAETGMVDSTVEAQLLLGEIVDVEKSLNELNMQKLEMLQNFTAKHPYIVALDQKQAELEKKLNDVKAQLRQVPLNTQEATNFQRDIKVHGQIYSAVMENMQQMQLLKGSTVSSVRVLEDALFPVLPIASKTPLILLASIILGISLSTAYLLLRQSLSHTLDPLVLEKTLGVNVLTVIPFSEEQKKLHREMKIRRTEKSHYLLCYEYPKDVAIEALRSLRTSLKLTALSENKKVIAISGCSPNVGKSFVSSNLSSLLADLGQKVLLIDADMRKGYVNKIFSRPQAPGLSEYLQGNVALETVIQKVFPNIDIITTGEFPSHPSELLMHQRFAELMQEVNQHYDIIFLDTPPVLAVTDASLLFKFADIRLLVVGSGKDQMKEIEHTKGVLEKSRFRIDGLVCNDLHRGKKYGYGGGYYNYSYRYEAG